MYALIIRVPQCMDELCGAVQTHVRQKGEEALAKNPTGMVEDPRLFVTTILEVHDQCLPLIVESFRNEKDFRAAFDKVIKFACLNFYFSFNFSKDFFIFFRNFSGILQLCEWKRHHQSRQDLKKVVRALRAILRLYAEERVRIILLT